MMSDKEIFKISAILFFMSFIALIVLASITKIKYVPIRKINDDMIGRTLETSGTVKYIFSKDGNYFITLENFTTIKVVFFSSQAKRNDMREIRKGMNVTVVGKVNEYKGEIEILGQGINI